MVVRRDAVAADDRTTHADDVSVRMPEKFGVYEGESESQYVGCIVCGNSIDLFESHPMFRDDEVSEIGDVSTRTYHFCSEDCLETWKRENQLMD